MTATPTAASDDQQSDNPLYVHGFLRVNAATNRYLEHADGTPFYWLGDTHWSGYSLAEHFDETNNASFVRNFVCLFGESTHARSDGAEANGMAHRSC